MLHDLNITTLDHLQVCFDIISTYQEINTTDFYTERFIIVDEPVHHLNNNNNKEDNNNN